MEDPLHAKLTVVHGARGNAAPGAPRGDDWPALVGALAQRDPAAARQAWDRFAPVVFRVLRRMLGEQDVDDVAQEVFLRVFDRVGSLRDPQALPAFVLAFTTRTAQWQLRKRRVLRLMFRDEASGIEPHVQPDPEAREALAAFYAVLDRLNAGERSAFVLRHMEGLEIKDVAQSLGVSESTAKRRIARAVERVKLGVARHPALHAYAQGFAAQEGGDD